jgi:hypothetical protein
MELIKILNSLPNLRVLYLKGNPVTRNISFYRKTLIKEIENLTYLDDRPVDQGERLAALAFFTGGLEAERKAREDYRKSKDMIFKIRDFQKEENRETFEERRQKALQSLRTEYVTRKENLENKKRKLMRELEEQPEKKGEITRELKSVDYQIEENEKFKINEEQDVYTTMSKRNKVDRFTAFEYEPWMDSLLETHVVGNLFEFARAVKLIQMDFKTRNVKNWELFNELDLRSRWTEIELKKFRKDEQYDYTNIEMLGENENKVTIQKDPAINSEESDISLEKNSKPENNTYKGRHYVEEEVETNMTNFRNEKNDTAVLSTKFDDLD